VLWPFLKNKTQPSEIIPAIKHNPQEQKLADTLEHMITDTLLLSDINAQPILVTDTLLINKDSLVIIGNNQTLLRADSSFKGPALVFTPACDYVVLENMVLENFDIAIISTGRTVHLKNVAFKNCGVGMMQGFSFPDGAFINGNITDTSFVRTDAPAK
jgi:hypothetical protein